MFHSIGIDVSKATLQVYIPIKDENISIDNSLKSIKALYSKLKKYYKKESKDLIFVFEPTGTYSSVLKHFCADKDITAFIVNPRQSANFAKALDNRSKSDIIDAEMLSKMAMMARSDDIAVPVIDEVQETLKEMLTLYKLLQKQRTALSNHLEALEAKKRITLITKKVHKEVKRMKQQEEELVDEMLTLINADEKLSRDLKNITSFVGIGDLAGIALLHLFISYPEANRQQISALSGLDPIETTSGTSLNRRSRISKRGNSIYRSILFMPVLVSTRLNPHMKAFYDRLKANNKHSTVAHIAVMRKMILITHSLYKTNQIFDSELYEKRVAWYHEKNKKVT
jgi:transposase